LRDWETTENGKQRYHQLHTGVKPHKKANKSDLPLEEWQILAQVLLVVEGLVGIRGTINSPIYIKLSSEMKKVISYHSWGISG
jgi:hypothetical protein